MPNGTSGKSIALNPKLASVRAFHAIYPRDASDATTKSIAEARTARELDPLSPLVNMSVGWALYFAGRFERGDRRAAQLARSASRARTPTKPHSVMMVAYELLGRFEEAAHTGDGSRLLRRAARRPGAARGLRVSGARAAYWAGAAGRSSIAPRRRRCR